MAIGSQKRMQCFIHGEMVVNGCSTCEEVIMQNTSGLRMPPSSAKALVRGAVHVESTTRAAHVHCPIHKGHWKSNCPKCLDAMRASAEVRCPVHGAEYVNGCTLCHEAFTKTAAAEEGFMPQSLTFVEQYFLGLAVEECGESSQWAGKALRFGIDTPGPKGMTARQGLHIELGDVIAAIRYGVRRGVLDYQKIEAYAQAKLEHLLDEESKDNLGRRLAP